MYYKINLNINNKSVYKIIFCSIILFFFKWFYSFYYYFGEDLLTKIIFEQSSDGYLYFVYLESLSNLEFNNSYDPNLKNLANLPIPLSSILFHTILYLFIGNSVFIFLEFICIFIFLFIFYLICKRLNFNDNFSILVPVFLFVLPSLISFFDINYIKYLTVTIEGFYNLRFPRPLVTNLFFFAYIYFLLHLNKNEIYTKKNFFILGIILAISFSSYYYYFVIEVISMTIFLIWKNNYSLNKLTLKKIKYYLLTLVLFIILTIPFLLSLNFAEEEYSNRIFLIELDVEKKKILLSYLLKKILSIKFLSFLFVIIGINFYLNYKKINNYKSINIFFIIFVSSILAPFIFIIISPKTGLVYHFTNYILITAYLYFVFIFSNLLNNIFEKKYLALNLIILLLSIYVLNTHLVYKNNFLNKNLLNYRNGFNEIVKEINYFKKNNKNISILTFDQRLMMWSIMNGIKDIKLLSAVLTPKTNDMIENDLINAFKVLNLNSRNFIEFFANEKKGWRYLNPNTQKFFWGTYSASALKTYKNSKDFDQDTLEFISKTSPLNVQSLVIPEEEFVRLENKFNKYKNNNKIKPDLIIISKRNRLYDKITNVDYQYSEKEINNFFKVLYKN